MAVAIFDSLLFVLASLSALLVAYGSVLFAFGQWSRHWPAVPGVIESSTLKTGRHVVGLRTYWVEARYSWHSDGARHGLRIGFACPGTASNPTSRSVASALQAELPPGARVDVFVCPRWRSISVLRIGPNLAALGYVCFGLVLACVSLSMA